MRDNNFCTRKQRTHIQFMSKVMWCKAQINHHNIASLRCVRVERDSSGTFRIRAGRLASILRPYCFRMFLVKALYISLVFGEAGVYFVRKASEAGVSLVKKRQKYESAVSYVKYAK